MINGVREPVNSSTVVTPSAVSTTNATSTAATAAANTSLFATSTTGLNGSGIDTTIAPTGVDTLVASGTAAGTNATLPLPSRHHHLQRRWH